MKKQPPKKKKKKKKLLLEQKHRQVTAQVAVSHRAEAAAGAQRLATTGDVFGHLGLCEFSRLSYGFFSFSSGFSRVFYRSFLGF